MTQSLNKDRLLEELSVLARRGAIDALGSGSNAVGKTLQYHLKIEHSTNTRNKKYGFTVTGTSARSGRKTNLFACVPNWKASAVDSSNALTDLVGRPDEGRGYSSSLFCTVDSLHPNGFGLMLCIQFDPPSLVEKWVTGAEEKVLLRWDTEVVFKKLAALGNTAIVTADRIAAGRGRLRFHFKTVELLGPPNQRMFLQLIDEGVITIDHLISRKVGDNSATEKGPLFKIDAKSRDQLYISTEKIDLLSL